MDDRVRWEVRVGGYENGRAPSSLEAHRLARELRKRFGVGKVTVWRIRRVTWTRVTDDPATWPIAAVDVLIDLRGKVVTGDCVPGRLPARGTEWWIAGMGYVPRERVTAWRALPRPARAGR